MMKGAPSGLDHSSHELLARAPGVPAAAGQCPAAQDNACLRARLYEFIELVEAPGLWVNQLTTLACQTRSDLDKSPGQAAGRADEALDRSTAARPSPSRARRRHLSSYSYQWARSVLDLQDHALDRAADHPFGVFTAACGHTLAISVTLNHEPGAAPCAQCVRHQLTRCAEEVAFLRRMVEHLVELTEADQRAASERAQRLPALAHQARDASLAELVERWIAAQRAATAPEQPEG